MNVEKGIERLQRQIGAIDELNSIHPFSSQFSKWIRDTEIAIEYTFGPDTRHLRDFTGIHYSSMVVVAGDSTHDDYRYYRDGLENARSILSSMVEELAEYSEELATESQPTPDARLIRIFDRFHVVARQLRARRENRPTLEVEDEYDVQDLLHALLRIDFDDVRPEEWTPSYAGSSARMDFLLKRERLVVEAKKTRRGLGPKELGDQLIVDIERYQTHPDCSELFCFVYDPEGRVGNPVAIESDLSRTDPLPVRVFVRPSGR